MIIDTAAQFLDEQTDDLVDFSFRLTADRGRAGVMAREAIQQLKDELTSMPEREELRALVFQKAYELNEEALRPLSRDFLEQYFRHHIKDLTTLGRLYRWELFLIKLDQFSSMLLLLRYRYQMSLGSCALALGRDEAELQAEEKALLKVVKKEKLELDDMADLPRYGFLNEPLSEQMPLSRISRGLQPRRRFRRVLRGLLFLLVLTGLAYALDRALELDLISDFLSSE